MVIHIDCIYEDCNSKRIQLRDKRILKTGEIRLIFKCEKCKKFFDDRLIPRKERKKFDTKVIKRMMDLIQGNAKVPNLKMNQRVTSSIIRNVLLSEFVTNKSEPFYVPLTSNIQLRMNKFMAEHGVSSLPLSPSSNLQ